MNFQLPMADMFRSRMPGMGSNGGFSPISMMMASHMGQPAANVPQPVDPNMPPQHQGGQSPLLRQLMMARMAQNGPQMGAGAGSTASAVNNVIQPAMNAYAMNRLGMFGK